MKNVDITKCCLSTCPRKETCIRWTHPVRDKYQSYLTECVVKLGGDDCKWWAGDYESVTSK